MPDPVTLTDAERERLLLEGTLAKAERRLEALRTDAQKMLELAAEPQGIVTTEESDRPLVIRAEIDLSKVEPGWMVRVAERLAEIVREIRIVSAGAQEVRGKLSSLRHQIKMQVSVQFQE